MKLLLVIDVPDDFETETAIAIVDIKNEKGEGVTAMCPLKPMPEKKDVKIYSNLFDFGWNACLREIEK